MKKRILSLRTQLACLPVFRATFVVAMLTAALGVHAQNISTFAGSNSLGAGYTGDGGAATAARLSNPNGVAVDRVGNIYIAEYNNHIVRKVSPSGVISTFAGTGSFGYSGDGGSATAATLFNPMGVAVDTAGNVYVADYSNHVVRKINTAGVISTFAGNGSAGFGGDGGAATAAQVYRPVGLCIDDTGNVYIGDSWNHRIRKVNTSGVMSTVAGNGTAGYSGDGSAATAAKLNYPHGIAVTSSGKLYVADYSNYVVREVNMPTGNIATVAGNNTYGYSGDGSVPTFAQLSHPIGVAVDPTQTKLYISDLDNNRVRMITNPPNIITYAGNGTWGFSGDGGAANAAKLSQPAGLICDVNGNLYICDRVNQVIRKVAPAPAAITGTLSTCVGGSTTLSTTVSSGYWVSGNPSVATVSGAGVVTGVAAGTARIYYSTSTELGIAIVTVNAAPAAITGAGTVCVGASTTLASTTAGGTWAASASSVATVSSSGSVAGVAAGTAVITYSLGGSCYVTKNMTVNPLPDAGTITGTDNVCMGSTTTLANVATGGSWSSSNTGIASVSATGVVAGVAVGTATISYSVTNSCGTNSATYPFTVNACPTSVGEAPRDILFSVYPNPADGVVELLCFSVTDEKVELVITNVTGQRVKTIEIATNSSVHMELNLAPGVYLLSGSTSQEHFTSRLIVK